MKPFFFVAFAPVMAVMLFKLTVSTERFTASTYSNSKKVTVQAAQSTIAVEARHKQLLCWPLAIYEAGNLFAAYVVLITGKKNSLLTILATLPAAFMIIHRCHSPNPLWFRLPAVAAISLPAFITPPIFSKTEKFNA